MDPMELSEKLGIMYKDAKPKEQTVTLIRFGIRYAEQLRACGEPPAAILELAKVRKSATLEINQGMRLARYVVER